jgi:hypothetical protein
MRTPPRSNAVSSRRSVVASNPVRTIATNSSTWLARMRKSSAVARGATLQKRVNPDRARNASQTGTAAGRWALLRRLVTSWNTRATPRRSPSRVETDPNGPGATDNNELNGIRTAYGGIAQRNGSRKHATT